MNKSTEVTILSSSKEKKATIVWVGGSKFGISKHCMSQTEFNNIFPNDTINNWEFIGRDEIINIETIKNHLNTLGNSVINWNVRRLN